jgi:hypothetical protein
MLPTSKLVSNVIPAIFWEVVANPPYVAFFLSKNLSPK